MARTPVLFIPGITGSFNLMVLLDWRGPTLSGWDFPPFVDYGRQFVAAFERAGYQRNRDLFVAFYDWRKAVRDSAETYLKPWIARAKRASGSKKVILVGHSMGGLVARSYIQSAGYADDVERLITLGTPHRGSAESYYAWGGGEPKADGAVQTAFNVYLWYLRHAHPFQTELHPVRTFRTQLPSVRDLLPVDDYLLPQDNPAAPKDEDRHIERNLWGDMLNQPAALATLLARVPLTTIAGSGFTTISTITVTAPPTPPGSPPLYPDGAPVATQVESRGDGTVLLSHAHVDNPQARSLEIPAVSHGVLPDHPAVLTQVFNELNVSLPTLAAAPVETPKLVIMTASPVKIVVRTPAGPPIQPPGVLGAVPDEVRPQRSRRIRARDHGHAGKHLNIIVVDQPVAGAYQLQVQGMATGNYTIGALMIGPSEMPILGASGEGERATRADSTAIESYSGTISADAALHFEVLCQDVGLTPHIRMNQQATADAALEHLRTALQQRAGGVLGGAAADPLADLLGGAPDDLRSMAEQALAGDADAGAQVARLLASDQRATMIDMLCRVAEQAVGVSDEMAAQAIITELRALG